MRKKYSTPMVLFEKFSLSTNIAATCNAQANATERSCGMAYDGEGFEGMSVFVQGITGCHLVEDDREYNGVCYDVPMGTSILFNS